MTEEALLVGILLRFAPFSFVLCECLVLSMLYSIILLLLTFYLSVWCIIQSPDVTISDTLESQLLPSTKKKSKVPYAILGLVSSAALGTFLGGAYIKRTIMDLYVQMF